MSEVIGQLLSGVVLPGAGAALLVAGLTLARQYAGRIKDAQLQQIVLTLVQAAEQIYGPGKGDAKRRFVRDKLKQRGLTDVSREDVEAAVYQMSQQG